MPDRAASRRISPPKQARAAAKRDAILDAAEALITQHPPATVTTRLVAESADVPIGSIYRYFADINDLLLSLFERINAGTVKTLHESLEHPMSDWRAELDRTFAHLATMHRDHPAYGALMAHVERTVDEDDEITALLNRLLKRNAPHLSLDFANDVTRTVIAMLEGVERRLHRLPSERQGAALEQVRLAIGAYLSLHIGEDTP